MRRIGIGVVLLGVLAYVAGFVVDHVVEHETASEATQRLIEQTWDAGLFLPLAAAGIAGYLWPRWWVVAGIAVTMFVVPIIVYEVGTATGFEEPQDESCDPCVDTRILSVLAFPALAVACVGLACGRWRRWRRSRTRATPEEVRTPADRDPPGSHGGSE